MSEKIIGTVAISNRHIHLTEEIYNQLFDEELTVKRPLNQIGEFASHQTATIKGPKGQIENVRLIGPLRKYNQVEVSKTDAYLLGVNPPVKASGDLANSETIIVSTPKGEVTLNNACIIAERHIHMNEKKAQELKLQNKEIVNLKVNGAKGGIMQAHVKVTSNGYYEIHLDKDDANSFLLQTGDEVEITRN